MEARALKSSLLSEVAMKSTTAQQVFFDDVWCVTNVGCDDFSVDDLLDFSDKDFKESFVKENEEKDSVSVDDDENSENSRSSENFASLTAAELTVPVIVFPSHSFLYTVVSFLYNILKIKFLKC